MLQTNCTSQEAGKENSYSNPRAKCSAFFQSQKPSKSDIAHNEGVDSLRNNRKTIAANLQASIDADRVEIQRLFEEGKRDKTIVETSQVQAERYD